MKISIKCFLLCPQIDNALLYRDSSRLARLGVTELIGCLETIFFKSRKKSS